VKRDGLEMKKEMKKYRQRDEDRDAGEKGDEVEEIEHDNALKTLQLSSS
jgi:hypothetical protein